MRLQLIIILLSSSLTIAGCSSSTTPTPASRSQTAVETAQPPSASSPGHANSPAATETAAGKPKVDACALLTSKEIESVQGEAIKETKLTEQSTGGLNVSQCFFTLPNFTNSISLLVAQKGGGGANDPKEFWRDTFHEDKGREKNEGHEKKKGEEEEEKTAAPPQKIPGIGDEAYWTRSRVGGALYVLKGDSYIRVSIGGAADQATKIKRSKVLAQKALARL